MEKVLESTYQTGPLDNVARKSANLIPPASGANVSAGIAGGGPSGGGGGFVNSIVSANGTIIPSSSTIATHVSSSSNPLNNSTTSNHVTANLITQATNGQPTTTGQHQQIIQVSSQGGGSIVSGQQLMVQTIQGRSAIQIRAPTGQQLSQIQFIPINNLQGQQQRQPVIIQQQSPSVLHSAVAAASGAGPNAITSMAHSNIAKITGVQTGVCGTKSSPLIIQQSALLHGGQATAHGLHHHNVAKIATVSRTPTTAMRTQSGKMINISTIGLAHHIPGIGNNNNHTTVTTTTLPGVSGAQAAGQPPRIGIISQMPGTAHGATVSTVHGGKPILNLTTATLATAKSAVILNPTGNVVQPAIVSTSGTMHNVVGTFSGPGGQFKAQQPSSSNTNLIPTVMTLTTLTTTGNSQSVGTRHTLVTTQPATSVVNASTAATATTGQPINHQRTTAVSFSNSNAGVSVTPTPIGNLVSVGSISSSTNIPTITVATANSSSTANNIINAAATSIVNSLHPNNHITGVSSSSSSAIINSVVTSNNIAQNVSNSNIPSHLQSHSNQMSPLRPNILSATNSPLNSPIKQPISQQTPSSPRPSILIRKRVAAQTDESKPNLNMPANAHSGHLGPNTMNLSASNASGVSASGVKLMNSSTVIGKTIGNHGLSGTSNSVMRTCDFSAPNKMNNSTLKKAEEHLTAMNLSTHTANTTNGPSWTGNFSNLGPRMHLFTDSANKQSGHTNENSMPHNNCVGNNSSNSQSLNDSTTGSLAITPRKRRKQLLEPFTLTTSQNIKLLNSGDEVNKTNALHQSEFVAQEENYLKRKEINSTQSMTANQIAGVSPVSSSACRRVRPSLLGSYNVAWKSLQSHFLRHSEVKVKEKRATTNLAEQYNESLQKRSGWKVQHLSLQLQDLIENESGINVQLQRFLHLYNDRKEELPDRVKKEGQRPFNPAIAHNSITIMDKLSDLMRANIQRSTLFQDQVRETNQLLLKLTNEHKERVNKLSKKYSGKRANAGMREKKSST